MPTSNDELLCAVSRALEGQWDAAHQIVQQHEGNPTADWIHAVLHKIEGDLANSRYWYRRCGKIDHGDDDPLAELQQVRAELEK